MSRRAHRGVRVGFRGFWRDHRGVSAVEFALIAPLLILMYCGMAELSLAMMAQRRLSNIASAIGDLVAQNAQTGPAKTADIFKIGDTIMAPFTTTALQMCLASVTSDAKGKNTVAWSRASVSDMANCPAQDAVLTDVPAGVLAASQTVILARASYTYTPTIKLVFPGGVTFNRTFYLRPRRSDAVIWNAAS
ncbi:TadE/TadG family type IV pilus assembly protein [Caulobacter sp. RL271]|jgi:Flp pilus assembly protein TadG|uniref:Pilus assembly protein n=1 Tax=Caulobacter segnis TaxID=88688 RepID=A0ABY4ZQA7_9CAUL|nr:TadE/TadG family type IV pilus assembly protein [Caulobacter segnis]USQ94973.1 pilus assembly protein [Caulobacter segnis]